MSLYLAFNEELHQVTKQWRVQALFLATVDLKFVGTVLVAPEQFGIKELAGRLSHVSVRGVNQFVDVLAVLVSQDLLIEPTVTNKGSVNKYPLLLLRTMINRLSLGNTSNHNEERFFVNNIQFV